MEKYTYVGGAAEGGANVGHGNHEDNNEELSYTAEVQQGFRTVTTMQTRKIETSGFLLVVMAEGQIGSIT